MEWACGQIRSLLGGVSQFDVDGLGDPDALAKLGYRDGTRPGNMTGPELCLGSNIEHDQITAFEPIRQLFPADRLQRTAIPQVVLSEALDASGVVGGHLTRRRPESGDAVAGQCVEDSSSIPASRPLANALATSENPSNSASFACRSPIATD